MKPCRYRHGNTDLLFVVLYTASHCQVYISGKVLPKATHQPVNKSCPEIREEKQTALPRSIHLSTFCIRSLVCSVAVSGARKWLSGYRPFVKARYGTADVRCVHRNGKQRLVDRHQLPLVTKLRHTLQQLEHTVQSMSLCVVCCQSLVVRSAVEIAVERKTVVR